jgi:hypothetical protein
MAWLIFTKHLYKFTRNGTELGGTLAAPLLLAVTFGAGMNQIVDTSASAALTTSPSSRRASWPSPRSAAPSTPA